MINNQSGESDAGSIIGMALMGTCAAAWITHIVVCLGAGKWGFLIAGAIFFPIAIIHGGGIWFGFW